MICGHNTNTGILFRYKAPKTPACRRGREFSIAKNILSDGINWFSHKKWPDQNTIAEDSRWKPFEKLSKNLS
jgi:hypothetical protein